MRLASFGGSEIAALIGKNKYRSHKDLLINKVMDSIRRPASNDCMMWGTLFEDVHKRYLEVLTD